MALYGEDKIGWSRTLRMGYKCACKGDYEDSIKYYQEALREGTDGALIHNNLADAYMNIGQLHLAMDNVEKAISKAQDKVVPYMTLGEIYQAEEKHKSAVECILKAQDIFEESSPEVRNLEFNSIEEIIKRLSTKTKFDLVNKDCIRLIYLVKTMKSSYQKLKDYRRRGVSWEFLLDMRKKALGSVGSKYLWSKEKLGIKGDDAAAIASTYGGVSAIIGSPSIKVIEKKREYSKIQISACWEYSVIKSMELDKDPGWVKCSSICTEYINNVAKAVNPGAVFEFNSTLPDGCQYCEGTFKVN